MAKATKYKPYKFPYNWNIADGYPSKNIEFHGSKVFGTFVCGGGSSMGYKLAGYEHLGGVEIDPKVGEVYKLNHKPKHFYLEDIRLFNKRNDLPNELYQLDLLDGSPPCSSFSMAGNRDKDWGKEKVFREGQELQRLDDLVFEYIKTIDKLKPKVAILENVKGLIQGNAKAYTKKIFKEFTKAGYRVQLFLLNAASMGVPQKRERVFFIGLRNDFDLPKLALSFNEKPIVYKEYEKTTGNEPKITPDQLKWWKLCSKGKAFSSVHPKGHWFNAFKLNWNSVLPTLTASGGNCEPFHPVIARKINLFEYCCAGTFPQDYDFKDIKPKYLIGMSVPPIMTAQILHQIYEQWLKKIK
jgi:DNA (cytosine-5)-methyltransferase 1